MENKQSSGFMNGMILGAAIGAGVVFFLGTKKGKKLLRTITDEGLESISDVAAVMTDAITEDDEEDLTTEDMGTVEPTTKAHPSIKRFFKGVPRKK